MSLMNVKHDSMRGWFAAALHEAMLNDERIWLVTGDLGWGMLDSIKQDFPDRFVNVGAAECLMLGVGVGLALSGKIPFCYSITPFLLYRGFEWVRNYIDHEKIPVMLVGSGLDGDYEHDGFTHHAFDAASWMSRFHNIDPLWPKKKEELPEYVRFMCEDHYIPRFLALRR